MKTQANKKAFVIQAVLLTEPNGFTHVWDSGSNAKLDNWPLNINRARQYNDYQEAWNRLQSMYSHHRHELNKVSFLLLETSRAILEDTSVDPIKRMEELNRQYSPREFLPESMKADKRNEN